MLIRYFLGEAEISFDSAHTKRAFSVIGAEDVSFRDTKSCDGRVSLFVPLYKVRRLEALLESRGIEVRRGGLRGFPHLLYRYRRRVGIPIGLLLCVLMIWASGRVIWCVNVEGNSKVSDREIISLLEKLGCGVGDTYDDIDFDTLHNRFLIESEGISWISVNMNGTHANVEVREIKEGETSKTEGFYNIVADENGQIERIAATEGKPVVEIGDTVLRGELLVSGAISYKEETQQRFESADGAVYARVNRSFEVNIPKKQTVKVETGREKAKKTLRIFNFNINLFRNSSIPYKFCDKITVYKQIYLFDSIPLPMYLDSVIYKEYTNREVTVSDDRVRTMAKAEYRKRLSEVLSDDTILSKTVKESFDGEVYTVRCELYCLADIAKKEPLIIEKKTENQHKETEDYGTENSQHTRQ